VDGIPKLSATIYRNRQSKGGVKYINYTLAYPLLGKLQRKTFADLDLAVSAGQEAIKRMANDEQRVRLRAYSVPELICRTCPERATQPGFYRGCSPRRFSE
jgi:hypothetical protein